MSVVTRATATRWASVLTGIALLCGIPPVLAARPVPEPDAGAIADLVAQASRSASVPHSGLTEVRARLGLPELPQLGEASRLLDGRTRARVWWESPKRWRISHLTETGERDLTRVRSTSRDSAGRGEGIATWDYDRRTIATVVGEPAVRLPRVDDLLPAHAARRILNTVGPGDRIERAPARRVAGVEAAGLRITPGDPRSRIASVSLWLDPGTGLPLALEVRDPRNEDPVLTSSYLSVRFETPPASVTQSVRPAGARTESSRTTDFAQDVNRTGPWELPPRLAGLPRADARRSVGGVTGGAATYGTGLTRFVLLPLPPDVARDALRRVRNLATPLQVTGGEAVPLERPLLTLVVARSDRPVADLGGVNPQRQAYLLMGTVDVGLLHEAVRQLVRNPPPPREVSE